MAPTLRKLHDVRVYAALASLLLSAWCVYIDPVVNDDGVLYLRVAQLITQGDWNAAASLYKWPFYSGLIAFTAAITGLGLEPAAHLLNALLAALAVVSFITIVKILGGDRITLVAAAAVVLLFPGINDYRSDVIRDTGYVAFYLLALVFYFKALNTAGWRLHAAWFAAVIVAALFRIEGVVLALAMLILLHARPREHPLPVLKISAIVAAALSVAFLAFSWWTARRAGGIGDILLASVDKILQPGANRIALLREAVLPKWSAEHATAVLFAGGAAILAAEAISRLTVINAFLAGHAWYRRLLFPLQGARRIWLGLVAANLAILAAIVIGRFYLTGRFPLAFSLTVMLAVPFSLGLLHRDWRARPPLPISRNWKFPAVVLLILLTAQSGLTRFTDKTYLKEGALWLKANTHPEARLLTNDIKVMHYSGLRVSENFARRGVRKTPAIIASGQWKDYDYVALNVKRKEKSPLEAAIAGLEFDQLRSFESRKGDRLIVYAIDGKSRDRSP